MLRLWVDVAGPVMPDRLDIVNMIQSLSELARQGAVRAPTDEETMRLACKTQVNGDIEVETGPPIDLFGENFFS